MLIRVLSTKKDGPSAGAGQWPALYHGIPGNYIYFFVKALILMVRVLPFSGSTRHSLRQTIRSYIRPGTQGGPTSRHQSWGMNLTASFIEIIPCETFFIALSHRLALPRRLDSCFILSTDSPFETISRISSFITISS